ncbi:MAG: DNA double-strand break repair nuclease NurA, partial [Chloroflexota bacterium]
MLIKGRVLEALHGREGELRRAASEVSESLTRYREAFSRMQRMPNEEIQECIGGVDWPGALPTSELDTRGAIIPFGATWSSAPEARAWALNILRGTPTAAVDGSQIAASKEFNVPISLVQVAWFENPHVEDLRYEKDLRVEIVLRPTMDDDAGDFAFTESLVNLARFTTEMDVAAECAQRMNPVAAGVVFTDGSFVLSFTGRMPPTTRSAYLAALLRLMDASRDGRVPVVGYIDLSYASDLCGLLGTAFD